MIFTPDRLNSIKIPSLEDIICKDECLFSFDSPESQDGLYICLKTFLCFGKQYVESYSKRSGNNTFLVIKRERHEVVPENEGNEPDKKIARLAIGVEGGFSPDVGSKKYEYETNYSIYLLPENEYIPYPNDALPLKVSEAVKAIIRAPAGQDLATLAADNSCWDGEIRLTSAYAENLQQLDNGLKIPPNGWKCTMCEKTDNLWLNLTDGTILCGRRQLDGSGGNHHAVEHYEKTKFPLAVKLGTITPQGKADVYSYPEDDMVEDPYLIQHLKHWGIDAALLEKTEKTIAEMEIELNKSTWEYSRITESGESLTPIFGPGFTGLKNLGNSCYINSVMQTLLMVPTFIRKYFDGAEDIFNSCNLKEARTNFDVQMAKLATGVLSGRYSEAPSEPAPSNGDILQEGVAPSFFRAVIGKGHSEFSTKRQQDAMEFFEHVLSQTERNARATSQSDPGDIFRFQVYDRFECPASGQLRYVDRSDLYLPLPVPLESAINNDAVQEYLARKKAAEDAGTTLTEEAVRAEVSFSSCLSQMVGSETVEAFSSAAGKTVAMTRTTRLKTCPDYLMIQLVKFGVSDTWQPVKYNVSVKMPETLSIGCLIGHGPQKDEVLMKEEEKELPPVNEDFLQRLKEMGFTDNACKRALYATINSGFEIALNWLMDHTGDPDLNDPLPTSAKKDQAPAADPALVANLVEFGFTDKQAILALGETNNSVERAADWLFAHQAELDSLMSGSSDAKAPVTNFTDGHPTYELVGFISHMGSSVHVGHYVCHLKRGDKWVIFNDEKVLHSVKPPTDLGYMYLYKRSSQSTV